ncbi:hypothetical protein GL263_16200 [Streptomyces durbertensis]|uniref:Uncharacterized protein n=1 Tax=Streptomyces durbertensis TaxID=2448886 RepID=A0ABR6EKQ0_9ACTN|nr:hypothetical protein [Streptomyces durbertensis]MBB1245099.1 hypothetical protein [Streptomyces durbertensis]
MAIALPVCGVLIAAGWRLWHDPTPYKLRDSPEVRVTVVPAKSPYPDVEPLARETERVIKVYVQRLLAGDAADLAAIGAPWYTGREEAARELISRHGAQAGEPVKAVVAEPVVDYLAYVSLRFADGSRQRIDLTRDKGVWWVQLGEGDPVRP